MKSDLQALEVELMDGRGPGIRLFASFGLARL